MLSLSSSCRYGFIRSLWVAMSFIRNLANFIKLFRRNLRCNRHIALSFDSGYAAKGINYAPKKFYEIDTWQQRFFSPLKLKKNIFTTLVQCYKSFYERNLRFFRNKLECWFLSGLSNLVEYSRLIKAKSLSNNLLSIERCFTYVRTLPYLQN